MEIAKTEMKFVAKVETDLQEQSLQQLTECQLALVGGGIGDVVLG